MRRIYGIILAIIIGCLTMMAQTVVSGSVVNKSDEALAGVVVLFANSDSIVGGTTTDSKGRFQLKELPAGEYECRVSMLGYKPVALKFKLSEKAKLPQFILEEDAKALAEVTVVGDKRKMTKELAGMSIYYLSDRAKGEMDIYSALQEIPRLIVSPSRYSVTLDNGTSPLILVNGVKKPLETVSPEFIESVEVIYNPPARYSGDESVSSVLNIKLKKDGIKPYLKGNLNATTTPNINDLYSKASSETGSEKTSIYVMGIYMRTGKFRSNNYSDTYQGDIRREQSGKSNSTRSYASAKIGGDRQLTRNDNIAFQIDYYTNPTKSKGESEGRITDSATDKSSAITSKNNGNNSYNQFAGYINYKHSFNNSRTLEFTGNYFYTKNGSNASREQNSDLYNFISDIDLHNRRQMGKFDINYSDILSKSIQLQAGSNTEHSVTDIDDRLDSWPIFNYRRTREYLYAGIDNNMSGSRFNYVVSLGLDMVFSDASGAKHSYIDVAPSVSLNYKLAKRQNVSLLYRRSRSLPSAGDLNPLNTSTDSLTVTIGNPKLTPSHLDLVKFDYAYDFDKFRLNPFVQYQYNSDIIMPYSYLDGNIYVNSYRNFGHTGQLLTGTVLSYNVPQGKLYYGGLSLEVHYQKDYIKGMPFNGNSFGGYFSGYFGYKNLSADAYFYYSNYLYSIYSKSIGEIQSTFNISWTVTKFWRLSITANTFLWPKRHSKSWTINGDYLAYNSSVQTTLAPKVCIGVMYNFVSKNFKWRRKKQFNGSDDELHSVTPN